MSRSEDKLAATKESIENEFPQCKEVITLAVDFSKDHIYDEIQRKLEHLERVDVLVNNVGLSYPMPDYFTKIRWASQTQIVVVIAQIADLIS